MYRLWRFSPRYYIGPLANFPISQKFHIAVISLASGGNTMTSSGPATLEVSVLTAKAPGQGTKRWIDSRLVGTLRW